MEKREPLVEDDRLEKVWEYVTSRTPGLEAAFPVTWVQPGKSNGDGTHQVPLAVFTIHEKNPRFPDHFQVSALHDRLDTWVRVQKEAALQHPFRSKVEHDPLTWVMGQLAKGHLHVMSELRAMSHPVQKFDGEGKPT